METAILNSMCRCCASEGVYKDVKTSYTWMGEEEVYADMLREIFDISLSTAEHGEDGGICEVCITQLRNAANFKKQVLHTEEQFKKHVNHKLFKPSIVKVEALPEDDNDSDDNNVSAEEGFSGPEFEVPIKTETEEQKPKKRAAAAKATTSRAKKAKNDNGESSTKREEDETVKTGSQTSNRVLNTMATINDIREEVAKNQNNLTQILKYTNATPILRQSDIGYFCYFCDKHCRDPAALKKHCLESHGNDKPRSAHMRQKNISFYVKLDITELTCNICNKNISTLEGLLNHLKNEHQKKIFTDNKNLIIPFKFHSETLSCYMCSNIFEKFKKLMEHMHTHYGNYMCEICGLGFITQGSLVSHSECHKVGTFECDVCHKPFNTLYKKNSHVKNVHKPKSKRFRCAFCVEKFTEAQKRNVHLSKAHGITSHHIKCRSCDKTFSSKWSMTLHTRRQHLMEKRFKCSDCDMMFFSVDELNKHGLKHSGVKEFKCDICLKSYARRTTLIEHMKIHNDDRRFKCENCGQAFVQKCSWKGHMKNKHGLIVS